MPSPSNIAKNRPLSGFAKMRADLAARSTALVNTLSRATSASIDWGRSSAGGSFASGCVASWFAVGFAHPLIARFGSSFPVLAGAFVAAILAMMAAATGARQRSDASRWQSLLVCLLVAVWAIAFGQLAEIAGSSYRWLSLEWLTRPYVQFAMALAASLLLLGVPIACVTSLSLASPSLRAGWLLSGAALGLVVAAQLVGPLLGIDWIRWIAAGCGLAVVVTRRPLHAANEGPIRSTALFWTVGGSLAVGIVAAALGRLTIQLCPSAEGLAWTNWTGLLLGAALGLTVSHRVATERRRLTIGWLILAGSLGAVLPLVSFGILIDGSLAATTGFSQVGWLILIRGVVGAGLVLPLGLIWGALLGLGGGNVLRQAALRSLPAFLAGCLAGQWLLNCGLDVPTLIAGGSVLLAAIGTALTFRGTAWTSRARAACACAAIVALVGVSWAARTQAFQEPAPPSRARW